MKELSSITKLANSFSKLPGIGVKSAERMAYAVLGMDDEDVAEFADAMVKVKENIHKCPICGVYTENDVCDICNDETRDHSLICVVSDPKDVLTMEKMNSFNGVYHVLGGVIAISKGKGADSLLIDALLDRVKQGGVKEIILATSSTLDGETTAMFVAKLLEGFDVTVTRLGYGLPMGASLDYADSLTLAKAFEGRKKI